MIEECRAVMTGIWLASKAEWNVPEVGRYYAIASLTSQTEGSFVEAEFSMLASLGGLSHPERAPLTFYR